MFVCEHWLKPCDLVEMNITFRNNNFWCNLKSSIPADQLLVGGPHGGVGFICRKPLYCKIKEIPQDDDRISVIQIVNHSQITLTISISSETIVIIYIYHSFLAPHSKTIMKR